MKNTKSTLMRVLLVAVLGIATLTAQAQGTKYVDISATGTNDGSSWANAYTDLQNAINNAVAGDNLFVKGGTYKPNRPADDLTNTSNPLNRDNAFVMKADVKIYGGFAGTEATLAERDLSLVANQSTLSGDIDNNNVRDDGNAYHVVISSGGIGTAVLDGFTITLGNANGSGSLTVNMNPINRETGAGMVNRSSSPMLVNCTFSRNNAGNSGGGMYNRFSSIVLSHCAFSENNSDFYGGGMFNDSSYPVFTYCTFSGNSADYYGGGMYHSSSSPVVNYCTFSGNNAEDNGGGIFTYNEGYAGHSGIYTNCVFNTNTAVQGGAVVFDDGSGDGPVFTNSTFYGNTATNGNVFYYYKSDLGSAPQFINSILHNASGSFMGFFGSGNNINNVIFKNSLTNEASLGANSDNIANILSADPLFTNAAGGVFTLKASSPAINAGNNTFIAGFDFDIAGNARIVGTTVDMGAFESPNGALPVRWISFEGRLNEQRQAVLTWKTEETNVSHYEVERSANAKDFHVTGTAIAGGTGSGRYSHTDPDPVSGRVYYRIRQVDRDGTFSYSRIISLAAGGRSKLFAHPNPARDRIAIELGPEYIGSKAGLIGLTGQVLQEIEVRETILTLDISRHASGVYLLQLYDGKVVKLVKE